MKAIDANQSPAAVSVAAQPPPSPPQFSADGKQWWDGRQWNAVASAPPASAIPAPRGEPVALNATPKKNKGRGKFILLGLGVAAVVLVGLLFLASKVPTASQGGFGVGAGPYYEHYSCQGVSTCMTDVSRNALSYEAYANNGNTGISYDFLALDVCQQIATADSGKWPKTWCSTSKNPGDTGP